MDIKKKKNQTHKYTWEKNLRNDKKNNRKFEIILLKKIYIYIYIYWFVIFNNNNIVC